MNEQKIEEMIKKIIIEKKVKTNYDLMRWTRQDPELEHYYLSNRGKLDGLVIEYVLTGSIK